MTYLLGDFLRHRKFPSKLVVAASGKDPSNCTLGSPNKVHTLRMTRYSEVRVVFILFGSPQKLTTCVILSGVTKKK